MSNPIIRPTDTILEAVKMIDAASIQIVFVADEYGKLVGTVTDGDVRRGLLKGVSLQEPVSLIMNNSPITAKTNERHESIIAMMKAKHIRHIPIVDESGVLLSIELLDELLYGATKDNSVVLMAGGLGTRLRPLTNSCPKPMLPIGDKPILETILNSFIDHGFRKFYFAVNYMSEMIETHFGDGSHWGVEIQYLREKQRCGTAGALSLLPEKPKKPLIVMNGDVLTKVNFEQLLSFHAEHRSQGTLCVREYEVQIPYGVVSFQKGRLLNIEEKPVKRYFVSAGIYVLGPDSLELVPRGTYYEMPALFQEMVNRGNSTAVFPIREYWLDIGHPKDFEQATEDYCEVFK